jgi:hypothetical protein
MLYEDGLGWEVNSGWWWRTPKDFTSQIEKYCFQCGFPVSLKRRSSQDKDDDVSSFHYEKLKSTSPKIKEGKYKVHDLSVVPENHLERLAAYKDTTYRNSIAYKYGMGVYVNDQSFWTPYMLTDKEKQRKSTYQILKERYCG